ncbi:general stress protein [Desulfoscipio gibsoniae]|uniref:Putative membrane protein n=1 Tax=Desulfoscipio gibsoniae DSM 7213 TaxID=767817 RepID=R4KJ34_9FIRM|nr:general stress protein [Desulfoscipio gibsoniae]AGL03233.1 putative membrane protein [Desulfoscipio gibsoniae DSM 7213]
MKTVLSTFPNRDAAEKAVAELRQKGFDKDISIVAKDDQNREKNQFTTMGTDNVSDGATTGGVLGGLAGLAVGAGALAIPGIGPLIAAGPIAGLLSGAATGGIAGGLVDYGIPQERSKFYEDRVKQGNILVTIRTDDSRINEAADTLRRFGAQDVETH